MLLGLVLYLILVHTHMNIPLGFQSNLIFTVKFTLSTFLDTWAKNTTKQTLVLNTDRSITFATYYVAFQVNGTTLRTINIRNTYPTIILTSNFNTRLIQYKTTVIKLLKWTIKWSLKQLLALLLHFNYNPLFITHMKTAIIINIIYLK